MKRIPKLCLPCLQCYNNVCCHKNQIKQYEFISNTFLADLAGYHLLVRDFYWNFWIWNICDYYFVRAEQIWKVFDPDHESNKQLNSQRALYEIHISKLKTSNVLPEVFTRRFLKMQLFRINVQHDRTAEAMQCCSHQSQGH